MTDITLAAQKLTRYYGSVPAVRSVGFTLFQGEVLGFLGPNGAGKSTTMQMLTGNLAPSDGEVSICGVDLLENPKAAKLHLGYLPEIPPLYRDMAVDSYLTLAARLHRLPRRDVAASLRQVKSRCGLDKVGGKLIAHLSKGYQQRVGIAQAIVHNPRVVILDEPTSGLDPIQMREIRALVRELKSDHSLVLSTHILPEVESVCDRVLIMRQGEIVFDGDIDTAKGRGDGLGLLVRFRQAPEASELLALPGVAAADSTEAGWRLRFAADADPTDTLVARSVEQGWGLVHLVREESSLEDVFVDLTREETTA